MMQILMMVCLISSPDTCREERLTLTIQGLDPAQCMYSSIPRIARWQAMHAGWRVSSWRCAIAGFEENA